MNERRVYILEGLCCANCAAKIEKEVVGLSEVLEASINLLEQKLTVLLREDLTPSNSESALLYKIKKIVKRIEPSVKVFEVRQERPSEGAKVDTAAADGHDHMHSHMQGKSSQLNRAKAEQALTQEAKAHKTRESKRAGGMLPYADAAKEAVRIGFVIAISAVLTLIDVSEKVELIGFILAYVIAGYDICLKALKNLVNGQIFDENFLMTIASLGAFLIGDRLEAVSVLVFYDIGEMLQDLAVNRSKRNIEELMDIRPDYANKIIGDKISVVAADSIMTGELILVKPGERVPLDGIVVRGNSFVDVRALTGESVPVQVFEGDEVLAGTVNQNAVLHVKVTKPYTESTVSKILELVRNAGNKKAQSEKFITKFARVYTPAVVMAAVAVAVIPPLLQFGSYQLWLYRALSFLIISCPCALVISIPLSYFGGIGGGARHGVLVKGSNYLDALQNIDTIVFDKTGTLTKGVFEVTSLTPVTDVDARRLLQYAAVAEKNSNHPIAKSIINYYKLQFSSEPEQADKVIELAGQGVVAEYAGQTILAGNEKLLREHRINMPAVKEAGSIVHVAVEGSYLGYIVISDLLKPDAAEAVKRLKKLGVRRAVMLTGDRKESADVVARQCSLDEYKAQLLPQDKVACFEEYKKEAAGKGKVVFVGDGLNDAPVLAAADIGIAMGGIGSDAAIEAADVVIMNDNPAKIATAISIARKTRQIVIQNIVFALGVKLLIMVLAFFGITSIWFAIFADVGVALLALLNAMRAMYIK